MKKKKFPNRLGLERLDDRTVPAALDPTFGTNGTATVPLLGPPDVWPLSAGGADGRVVAAARDQNDMLSVARLNSDGTPDKTFAGDGTAELDVDAAVRGVAGRFMPRSLTVAGDGSVAVAGEVFTAGGEPTLMVVRFTADGKADLSFDGDGIGVYDRVGYPIGLAVAADGSITVVGFRSTGGELPTRRTDENGYVLDEVLSLEPIAPPEYVTGLYRIRPDGSLDTSFGTGGFVEIDRQTGFSGTNSTITRTVPLPDGGMLLIGQQPRQVQDERLGPTGFMGMDTFVTRLNADGSKDTGYGINGTAVVSTGTLRFTVPADADLTADGGLLLTLNDLGIYGPDGTATLARLTADGRLDTGFGGGDGLLTLPSAYFGMAAGTVVGPAGRAVLVFAGIDPVEGSRLGVELVGVTADGTIDRDFGQNGTAFVAPVDAAAGWYHPVVVDLPDGRIGLASRPGSGTRPNDPIQVSVVDPDAPTAELPPVPDGVLKRLEDAVRFSVYGYQEIFPGEANKNTNTAYADVNGDGTNDAVYAAGEGNKPYLRVVDGRTKEDLVPATLVYEESFTGGVLVSAADLDGDGKAEIITVPQLGGSARVQTFRAAGGKLEQVDNFYAIGDPDFRGGGRVAAGDVNGDGTCDLVVGAGDGGGPRVAVYDGKGLARMAADPRKLVADFFAFGGADAANLRNGVYVATGDLDGDGKDDLIFGAGEGGGPRVTAVSGADLFGGGVTVAMAAPLADFFAGDAAARDGVELRAADLTGDGKAELIARPRSDGDPAVRVYTLDETAAAPREDDLLARRGLAVFQGGPNG